MSHSGQQNRFHWIRERLDNLPLKRKMYVALGVLIAALLLVGANATYTAISTQRFLSDTLGRQRRLADLAADLNSDLLNIQNTAFEFYETWTLTGFEQQLTSSGFDRAVQSYLDPIQDQLDQIRGNIAEMKTLDPALDTADELDKIATNVDAYETSLEAMAEQMRQLGYRDTGEFGELEKIGTEIQMLLQDSGMDALQGTMAQIDQNAKGFFLRSELPYVRRTREFILRLTDEIDAATIPSLTPATQDELHTLLDSYYDHFLVAANQHRNLQKNRTDLLSQSNLTSTLLRQLYRDQRARFAATVDELQRQQSGTVTTTLGLGLIVLLGGTAIAYLFSRQVIRPIQLLGAAAERLGRGDLKVRAPISARDEIGKTGAAFNMMADQMQGLLTELEQRVAERTSALEATTSELAARSKELEEAHRLQIDANRDLEQAIRRSERRANLLQANAQVSRAAVQLRDVDELLSQVARLISQRFGYYHVGIFLIDAAGREAVLQASNSEGGQRMLARHHQLRVGSEGIVGNVTGTGHARIALDVGGDAVFFDNPDLPATRSEMAVPLRIGEEIIGALDVQSETEAAFDQEDVDALSALADQVAIAIQNARLFRRTQLALEEAQRIQQLYVQQQWAEYAQERTDLAYEYALTGAPTESDSAADLTRQAWTKGQLVISEGDAATDNGHAAPGWTALAIPIQVRGETIGVLDLQDTADDHVWSDDEISLIQTVADQLGQALEGARLYEQTQASLAETRALFQTSRDLAAAQSVEDIWEAVIGATGERGADACGLFLFDTRDRETASELEMVAGWDKRPDSGFVAGLRLPTSTLELFKNAGSDPSAALIDLSEGSGFSEGRLRAMRELGFAGALVQPIAVRGRWFGLLTVHHESSHTFTSSEMDFYRTLTDQAALALEGQQLLLDTRRRAEREQLIRQITDRVRATSDVGTILQTTVEELSKAMGLPRAFVRLGTEQELVTTAPRTSPRGGQDEAGDQANGKQ
jgi:GAF domain-containing protein/methyl-accepting chemotaxis protein